MPELPEVQTIVDVLNAARVAGRQIERVRIYWPGTIAGRTPEQFRARLKGRVIARIGRRAKYIVVDLDDAWCLLIHLRMTGRLALTVRPVQKNPHIHVVMDLDDGRALIFHDTRKFGRFYLTPSPETIIGRLGPEPLSTDFTARSLRRRLAVRRRRIKPLLLDQSFLAGLGNIYVDEALWTAGIHPLRLSHSLSGQEVTSLHRAIRSVLRKGIQNAGTSLGQGLGNFVSPQNVQGRNGQALKVFRRNGEPCNRCGRSIEKILVAQRGTHICPACQVIA